MKTKIITIILLAFVSLTVSAQQKKVAVYVTGTETSINKVLGDKLVEAFAKSGKYIAIERTASFLAELGKEQKYQRTGAVDDNELSRIGKQFGVQLVCVADISEVFNQKYVSARLIDVESAEVVNSANVFSQLASIEDLNKVCGSLKSKLFDDLPENSIIPVGYVDLGLPSGTLFEKESKSQLFTYDDALKIAEDQNAGLPTFTQCLELLNECTWKWEKDSYGNYGYKVQGSNGNSIFLHSTDSYRDLGAFWITGSGAGSKSKAKSKAKEKSAYKDIMFFDSHSHKMIIEDQAEDKIYQHGVILIKPKTTK